ncbi:MAG: hypothetical protein HGA44_06910, partial [Cellulomonadaceae bacterium]|nr:hypothetical protein [Cellulomonadaceae bacterium]
MSVVSSGASRRPPGTGSPAGSPGAPGVAVESATWRPVRTVDLDGWLLGVSGGFTRRANSVLPLAEPADLDAALAAVEHEYHGAGRAAVFRVCAAARPADLAARLRGRGYRTVAATQVLVRGVDEHARAPEPTAGMHLSVADVPDDAWLDGWLSVKATAGDAHRDLARSVVHGSPALYVRAVAGERTLGVVRAARAGDWVGLS